MTIKTLAIVPEQSGVKIAKNKIEIEKGKSFKYDAVYTNDTGLNLIYSDRFSSLTASAAIGINESFMQFTDGPDRSDIFRTTNSKVGFLEVAMKEIFQKFQPKHGKPEHIISVSMAQVTQSGELKDLGNPHDRPLSLKQNASYGTYIQGLSQIVCGVYQDVVRFYEDGCQLLSALKLSPILSMLVVRISNKPGGAADKGTISTFKFVNVFTEQRNFESVQDFLSSVAQKKGKVPEKVVASSNAMQLL
uniref:Kinesin motor domain-containing protein n=1 Tax=Ciona savignyi TaxID=51511 RepID=H2Z1U9_CIOSA